MTGRFGGIRKKRRTRSRGRTWDAGAGRSSESNFRLPVTEMCAATIAVYEEILFPHAAPAVAEQG